MKKERVERVVSDEDIGTAITVVIRHANAHSLPDMAADAPFFRDVFECAIAFVEIKLIGKALVGPGVAIFREVFVPAFGFVLKIPANVVDYEQIQKAVVIHIHPGGGYGPVGPIFRIGPVKACFCRDIRKGTVPIVVIKRIVVDSGDEQVGIPVIIEVADRNPHVVSGSGEPGLACNVSKRTVTIVTKKAIVKFNVVLFQGGEVGAVSEEDIRAAVFVEIKDCDTSCHGGW